ncbi:MAG: FAD-dependent oxidoreductase [Thermoproteota archaeon]
MTVAGAEAVQEYDVVVVGAGVAGLTAAMYLARQGLSVLVVSADLGGQLLQASVIENYPGLEPVSGSDLALRVKRQAEAFGAKFRLGERIVRIERLESGKFKLVSSRGRTYIADAVIVASGKTPKRMGVPGEREYEGRGISYCTICDGPIYRGRRVAVVGLGYQGLEAASLLADICPAVFYVTPTKAFGSAELLERLRKAPNVTVLENHEPVRVEGDGKRVTALVVRDRATGEEKVLEVEGVFVELGYEADTSFVSGLVDLNERGEIVVSKVGETKTPGLFAAGDVTDMPFKQAVISAGMGAAAALAAINYIHKLRGVDVEVRGDWKKTGKVVKRGSFRL